MYYLQKCPQGGYLLVDIIVLSKFFEGYLKVLLVPELSDSHRPRDGVRTQTSITAIVLSLSVHLAYMLWRRGKGERECWDI